MTLRYTLPGQSRWQWNVLSRCASAMQHAAKKNSPAALLRMPVLKSHRNAVHRSAQPTKSTSSSHLTSCLFQHAECRHVKDIKRAMCTCTSVGKGTNMLADKLEEKDGEDGDTERAKDAKERPLLGVGACMV